MVDNDLSRRKVVVSTAGLSALGLAGCLDSIGGEGNGNGNGADDEDVEEVELGDGDIVLEFSGWGEGVERETVEDMLASFAEERDEIGVEFQHVPEDYEDRLRTQFGAGEEPDAFYMGLEPSGAFEEVLVDLETELEDGFLDDFDESVLEAASPREGLYFIPKDFQYCAWVHNTEALSNAGYDEFPEHWDEFREMLEAIDAEDDVDNPAVMADNFWVVMGMLEGNGGQVMNDEGTECVIHSEENVEVLTFLQELVEDDLLVLLDEIAADAEFAGIGEGEVAMGYGGGWFLTEIKDGYEEMDEHIDIAPPPYPEDGEGTTLILTAGYSVSENTEYMEESIDLVEYLMGDGMIPWLETGIALSIVEPLRDEVELYQEDERYQEWFEMSDLPRLHAQEYGPETEEIMNTMNPQFEGVFQGNVTPEEALETIEDEVNNRILE